LPARGGITAERERWNVDRRKKKKGKKKGRGPGIPLRDRNAGDRPKTRKKRLAIKLLFLVSPRWSYRRGRVPEKRKKKRGEALSPITLPLLLAQEESEIAEMRKGKRRTGGTSISTTSTEGKGGDPESDEEGKKKEKEIVLFFSFSRLRKKSKSLRRGEKKKINPAPTPPIPLIATRRKGEGGSEGEKGGRKRRICSLILLLSRPVDREKGRRKEEEGEVQGGEGRGGKRKKRSFGGPYAGSWRRKEKKTVMKGRRP